MKVAVSGASGLIGSALVPALEAAGHDVVRLVRREARTDDEIEWDPDAGTIDAPRLAGVDAVVTLSGENVGRRWTKERKAEIRQSRVASTDLLARTAAALEPRPSVFIKSGGLDIYGDRGDEILTEGSSLSDGFLAEVAQAWEAAAEPARAAGIRVVDFRQGIMLSVRGGAIARMHLPFKLGLGGPVAGGRQWWSWVALDDAASAYRFALEGDLSGPVNLTSPRPVTNAQFVKALGRALGRPTILPFPRLAVTVIFGEMGEASLLPSHRALPTRLLQAGFEFRYPEIDSALPRALER